ncbi:hypothetical protein [Aeromicrobium sp. UC242_57]|uniref:hypothetical protein n=1 Tax=Aeromicrobium sp. UC242_57 TaxID=3374624 RepID=UPI00378EC456
MSVNLATGEILDAEFDESLSAEDARILTDQIRQTLRVGHDLIIRAFQGRAWSALGYATWDAYCAGEFNEARMVRLDREQRLEIVAEMRQAGMSTTTIASGIGVSKSTVHNDLPVLEARGYDLPDQIIETGGRSRTATSAGSGDYRKEPAPQRATRRAPLTDFAFDASTDLLKVAERLSRVLADDRFKDNRTAISQQAGGQINRSMELIAQFSTALKSEATP